MPSTLGQTSISKGERTHAGADAVTRAAHLPLLIDTKAEPLVREEHLILEIHRGKTAPRHLLLHLVASHHVRLQQRLPRLHARQDDHQHNNTQVCPNVNANTTHSIYLHTCARTHSTRRGTNLLAQARRGLDDKVSLDIMLFEVLGIGVHKSAPSFQRTRQAEPSAQQPRELARGSTCTYTPDSVNRRSRRGVPPNSSAVYVSCACPMLDFTRQ